jgi:crotonobetainyl-CoA:carnitine CoA-transferase CaiB-like acyl-CoA transferase
MTGALEGARVVEVANYVAGPYASMLLADLGADVIKIEAPPHGDPYRNWASGGYSSMFCSLNRNKKSILLDLRTKQGLEVALVLTRTADVLIENARPGAMDRLGLGFDALHKLNPRLIYCSITGFGPTGPYSGRPGYDTVGQAMSGLLSLLTDMHAPQAMGISLSDHLGGLFGCYAILAALAGRERTGEGQHVNTSLLQSSVAFLAENMTRYLEERRQPPTRATRAQTAQAYAFKDREGAPFVVHLSSPDKFWQGLARAIGRPELQDDPRFATRQRRIENWTEIQGLLDASFATDTRERWLERLQTEDVPSSALNNLQEVLADPQVQHLGLVQEVTHPRMGSMQMVGSGITLESTPTRMNPAPLAGEHTEQILAELGFSPA